MKKKYRYHIDKQRNKSLELYNTTKVVRFIFNDDTKYRP